MSRISREFVKLETRLLNDHRFFTLTELEQLVFLKFLAIARITNNQIPKNLPVIRAYLRTNRSETEVEAVINRLKEVFHKFKENKYFYYFEGYEKRINNNSQKFPGITAKIKSKIKNNIDKAILDEILKTYIAFKGYDQSILKSDDYGRYYKAIKLLMQKAETKEEAIAAVEWTSRQGYEWTLETVVKKFPDFKKPKPKMREL